MPAKVRHSRREQILDRAADLFAARGFHGTSVDDVGAACGISGPALYRHFASKDAMLAEMLVGISELLLAEARKRSRAATPARDALGALLDWHIDFALGHRALIVVQDRDWDALPDEARARVRRLQRAYIDLWADQLSQLADGIDRGEAQTRARAVFGLLNSTPRSGRLPDAHMRRLLTSMAWAALLAS
jgi:AcrR family transcriptional regulator